MEVPGECEEELPQEQGAPFPLGLTLELCEEPAGFSRHLSLSQCPINSSRLMDKELLDLWTEVPRGGGDGGGG